MPFSDKQQLNVQHFQDSPGRRAKTRACVTSTTHSSFPGLLEGSRGVLGSRQREERGLDCKKHPQGFMEDGGAARDLEKGNIVPSFGNAWGERRQQTSQAGVEAAVVSSMPFLVAFRIEKANITHMELLLRQLQNWLGHSAHKLSAGGMDRGVLSGSGVWTWLQAREAEAEQGEPPRAGTTGLLVGATTAPLLPH